MPCAVSRCFDGVNMVWNVFFEIKMKKVAVKFGGNKKCSYLCNRLQEVRAFSSAGLEHLPYKQRVGGSNPSTPTKGCFPVVPFMGCRDFFCLYISFSSLGSSKLYKISTQHSRIALRLAQSGCYKFYFLFCIIALWKAHLCPSLGTNVP